MPYLGSSSGTCCAVVGCRNSTRSLYEWKEAICKEHPPWKHRDCPCLVPFSFHKFPNETTQSERRMQWVKLLNRTNFKPGKNSFVCSVHFQNGRPTKESGYPTLNLGYKLPSSLKEKFGTKNQVCHKVSLDCVKIENESNNVVNNCSGDVANVTEEIAVEEARKESIPVSIKADDETHPEFILGLASEVHDTIYPEEHIVTEVGVQVYPTVNDICTQTEENSTPNKNRDHSYAKIGSDIEESSHITTETMTASVETQVKMPSFSYDLLSEDDFQFYTGLSKEVFLDLVLFLCKTTRKLKTNVKLHNQILLVLCRLRLGLLFGDLGRRFGISPSYAARIAKFWTPVLTPALQDLW